MINLQEQNFIMYSVDDKNINIQILADKENETIWLSQKQIAEIFDCSTDNVSLHIKNIYKEEELYENSTSEFFSVVQKEGNREVSREIKHYNLDMIIAIGYRVNSKKATQFRIWATKTLKEYLIKGFILDDERLKQGNNIFNKNYIDELIERIREIRASEKIFYEKVRDLFKLSVDYSPNSELAKNFFATAQNKLEFAITKQTSAEIIYDRANSQKDNMGLTTWSGNKRSKALIKSDALIAKNYLSENELKSLNLLTTMLLDYAENQAKLGNIFSMKDWENKLDSFLEFNGYEVLNDLGKISREKAVKKAELEYEKFKELKQKNYIDELKNQ